MTLMQALYDWKNEYLAKVGVPRNSQAEWDFISAISACWVLYCPVMHVTWKPDFVRVVAGASDATYHLIWISKFTIVNYNFKMDWPLKLSPVQRCGWFRDQGSEGYRQGCKSNSRQPRCFPADWNYEEESIGRGLTWGVKDSWIGALFYSLRLSTTLNGHLPDWGFSNEWVLGQFFKHTNVAASYWLG